MSCFLSKRDVQFFYQINTGYSPEINTKKSCFLESNGYTCINLTNRRYILTKHYTLALPKLTRKTPSIGWHVEGFFEEKCIVKVNLLSRSKNPKTGDMLKVAIFPEAWLGAESHSKTVIEASEASCGNCVLKSHSKEFGVCYVKKGTAGMGLRSTARSNNFIYLSNPEKDIEDYLHHFKGREVRLTSFGEPVLLGKEMVEKLVKVTGKWTGYTHQWRNSKYQWAAKYFNASVHSLKTAQQAQEMGWRTFRVMKKTDTLDRETEFMCPASKESGQLTTCQICQKCNGTESKAKSVAIYVH